jgi:hypothetical protein
MGSADTRESASFEIMLNRALNQLESTEGDRTGGTKSPTSAEDPVAENPASTGDSPGTTGERLWSKPRPGTHPPRGSKIRNLHPHLRGSGSNLTDPDPDPDPLRVP